MNIAVIGTGYVGLVSGTCLAEMGNSVTCVDIDKKKIDLLKDGIIPIYEPGLEDLVKSNFTAGRLQFTTDMQAAIKDHDVLMIAVGTPPSEDGSADLKHVLNVATIIAQNMQERKIIITKSTVPVGTGDRIKAALQSEFQKRGEEVPFSIASNPEFLKEGTAVNDFMRPDRIVIGCEDEHAKEILGQMYHPFVLNGHRLMFMDIRSAELTKYAANALLATKISFINEVSRLAEKLGADISSVRQGIGSDSRIGFHFIYPGIGYGGSCFPKDVKALVTTAHEHGMNLSILEAVEDVNQKQRDFYIQKVLKSFNNDVRGRRIAIWGLSFKPETDDIREAPAIDVIRKLLDSGAEICAYDPIAMDNVKVHFNSEKNLHYADNLYDALNVADALLLLTEWKPFRSPDFARMKSLMKKSLIIDARNQYDPEHMRLMGFSYICIGRPPVLLN